MIVTGILVLCTANVCRSPMAASLLARELATRDFAVPVRSAGMVGGGSPPTAEAAAVMAGYGLDLAGHRSHVATAADLARAELVITMSRMLLRHAVVLAPDAWPRVFTLRELVRRGDLVGRRAAGETVAGWLARLHAGRSRLDLLGDSARDEVADPVGGPLSGYEATAAGLQQLARRLSDLCWPAPAE